MNGLMHRLSREELSAAARHPSEAKQFRRLGRLQQYGAVFSRLVFLADACTLYIALYLTVRMFGLPWSQRFVTLALLAVVVFGITVSFDQVGGTWRLARLRVELSRLLWLHVLSFAIVLAVLLAQTSWIEDDGHLLHLSVWFLSSLAGMAAIRTVLRLGLRVYRMGPADHRRVAFLGASEAASRLADVFRTHPWIGVDVVGFYRLDGGGDAAAAEPGAGGLVDLLKIAQSGDISAVYIALPAELPLTLATLVDSFADTTVSIYYCPSLSSLDLLNAYWDDVFGHPVVSIVTSPFDGSGRHIKRLEDLILTLALLPLIVPLLLLIALVVKFTSGGNVFYVQSRHGLDGRAFKMYKFRTMFTADTDHEFVQARTHDPRITPVGAFLRRTSLDELPQFLNVLKGQMSVVGPRPAPIKYNQDHRQLIRRYMMRHKVKPGITGLAQVNGCRGETLTLASTEERTALDLEYIDTWSLWLDIRILARTVLMMIVDRSPR